MRELRLGLTGPYLSEDARIREHASQDAPTIGGIDCSFLRTPPLQAVRRYDLDDEDDQDSPVPAPREPMLSYSMRRKSQRGGGGVSLQELDGLDWHGHRFRDL